MNINDINSDKIEKKAAVDPLLPFKDYLPLVNLISKADVTGASSHSGRRQYITALAENQINIRVIQALARHSHINTTMRYIDVNDIKLANAVESVNI